MSFFHRISSFLEVKSNTKFYSDRTADRWGNHDIFPIPLEQRHYTARSYWTYWIVAGICIGTWTFGSSLIAAGLTAGQAVGAVLIGATMASSLAYFCGQAGRDMHLG